MRKVEEIPRRPRLVSTFEVALVNPLSGPAGIFGPSCELCALLAAEEVNAAGGLLGRELRFISVDGGAAPHLVANEVASLVEAGLVDAVTGWHISAVREALAPRVAQHVPYVYTALYEGGEHRSGVFLTGETPERQIAPAMTWMADELGIRRWTIVGDDYVWPRGTAQAVQDFAPSAGFQIQDAIYVDLGTDDFTSALQRVDRSGCDAVLMLLVGNDAVHFNRQFAAAGLDGTCLRFSPLMEENMLLASGQGANANLFAAAGFFEALGSASSLDFGGRFAARFGADSPPLNSLGESCYEGVRLLAELVNTAGTTSVRSLSTIPAEVAYDGPRGHVRLQDRHLNQAIYLSQAVGLEFDVLCRL